MELMPVYGPQFKEQIVKKMMPPHNQSVAQISRDTGVAVPTLYSWKKLFRNQGFVVPAKSSRPDDWDSKAKLAAIIQTAAPVFVNKVVRFSKRPSLLFLAPSDARAAGSATPL